MRTITKLGDRMLAALLPEPAKASACTHCTVAFTSTAGPYTYFYFNRLYTTGRYACYATTQNVCGGTLQYYGCC